MPAQSRAVPRPRQGAQPLARLPALRGHQRSWLGLTSGEHPGTIKNSSSLSTPSAVASQREEMIVIVIVIAYGGLRDRDRGPAAAGSRDRSSFTKSPEGRHRSRSPAQPVHEIARPKGGVHAPDHDHDHFLEAAQLYRGTHQQLLQFRPRFGSHRASY